MSQPAKVAKYAAAIGELTGYEVTSVEERPSDCVELTFWTINFAQVLGGNGLADRQGWIMFAKSTDHGHTRYVGGAEYRPLLPDHTMPERQDLDSWIRTRSYR
jgi:hypothetical protein